MTQGQGNDQQRWLGNPGDDPLSEQPGDPACWLRRVCQACGAMADADPPTTCPACGAEMIIE
jgi:rubrerythrin